MSEDSCIFNGLSVDIRYISAFQMSSSRMHADGWHSDGSSTLAGGVPSAPAMRPR